jgi:hypothetical protein
VLGVVLWAARLIPLPHPFGVIAQVVVALIAVVMLLRLIGALPGRL